MSLYGVHRLVFLTEVLCSMLVLAFIRPRLYLQLEGRGEGGGGDVQTPRFCCGLFQQDCVLLTDSSILNPRYETWE